MIKQVYVCVHCGKYEENTDSLIEIITGQMASFYIHSACYQEKGLNSREVTE